MKAALLQGAQALGLALDDGQLESLLAYLALLAKWNRVYNLTAVRSAPDMLTHHLLDSLAVLRPLQAQTQGRALKLLDAGSGGGLPGVALAICRPELDVTCVDAVAKKAAFKREIYLSQAKEEGKPAQIAEKIVEGRIRKFYQEVCLVEQAFIKDDKKTIKDLLGKNAAVARFCRFAVGA